TGDHTGAWPSHASERQCHWRNEHKSDSRRRGKSRYLSPGVLPPPVSRHKRAPLGLLSERRCLELFASALFQGIVADEYRERTHHATGRASAPPAALPTMRGYGRDPDVRAEADRPRLERQQGRQPAI